MYRKGAVLLTEVSIFLEIVMSMESDAELNLAKVRALAIDTFGSEHLAESWLNQYHTLLGVAPIVVAETSSGLVEIQKILSAISYGGVV